MIPHEKALVKRLEKEPFALIGINSDGSVEKLREILKTREINWRQAVDESTEGPLATRWNVSGWPTIYVIDAKGVIRYRDVREAQMDEAVDALLAELKTAK
ncbi:MAG TPA: TlpA disulfide reductase family protein [Planctomycetota bacterium]|nr:TlpA disulfide reductase family protein [Planctomycetota bacterium]